MSILINALSKCKVQEVHKYQKRRAEARIIVIHRQDPGAARLSLVCSPGGKNDFSRHSPL